MIPFDSVSFIEIESLTPPIPGSNYGTVLREWDLLAGNYALQAYAPAVAPWRRSRLGGDGSYEEVEDEIVVTIAGGTAAACVQAYDALFQVLDQAAQWWRGDAVNAIQIRMSVRGGTAGELAAAVLGPPPGDVPGSVNPDWDDGAGAYVIRDVALRFGRRGALLGITPATAAATVVTGEIATLTWAESSPNLSPVDLRVQPTSASAGITVSGYVFAGPPGSIGIAPITGYGVGPPGGVTTVADTNARSGAILRYVPPDANPRAIGGVGGYSVPISATYRRAFMFALARHAWSGGSATVTFTIAARVINYSSGVVTLTTLPVVVPATNAVSVVYLGQIAIPGEVWPSVGVVIQSSAASAVDRLDLSDLYFVADAGDATTVLAITSTEYVANATAATIAPRLLTDPTPQVVSRETGAPNNVWLALNAFGDRVVQQRGTQLLACSLMVGGNWRPTNIGGSLVNVTITGLRSLAYRVPQ